MFEWGRVVKDWNVVVTIFQQGFRRALRALQDIAPTERSPYHNVLVMKVDDPVAALETIERLTDERPALYDAIARVAPALRSFEFGSTDDFKDTARSVMTEWLPDLAGRSFHVRLHRRGPNLELRTPDAERLFNDAIVAATTETGSPARISFTDPDAVIVIDTVDDRAGLAVWTRQDLVRHRLLRPD
jgi:tRNA(Ser,Leu) C12 N-acetylase TAN1